MLSMVAAAGGGVNMGRDRAGRGPGVFNLGEAALTFVRKTVKVALAHEGDFDMIDVSER